MKVTDPFKKAINDHLENVAKNDPLFAETLKKPNKNINDCSTYILNEVKKSGHEGFEDQEVFAMAVHYYDEDNIDIGKPISCKVVVNHSIKKEKKQPAAPLPIKTEVKTQKPKVAPLQNSLF